MPLIPPKHVIGWDEAERLAALRSYGILDTDRERAFDDFAQLARQLCSTKMSLISFVDADRQWFKAEIGLGLRETPLDLSICGHAILQGGLFEVPDTTDDPRFLANPLVTGHPHLRFYAGVPLLTEAGLPIGTLCVLDDRARPGGLDAMQRDGLVALARQVMVQVEMRRALEDRAHAEAALTIAHNRTREILASIDDPFYVVAPDWRVIFVNTHVLVPLGLPAAEVIGQNLLELFPDIDGLMKTDGIQFLHEVMQSRVSGRREIYSHAFRAWCDMAVYPMSDGGLSVYIKNIDARKQLEADLAGALARVQEQLAEKELLMLETHHRVKNSLQMVQSLLTLQARAIEDTAIAQQVQESAARVRTFGALHETLYHIADGTQVDIRSYLEKLVSDLNAGMGGTLEGRPIRLAADRVRWPASEVSTLGLVLTELVTNALKYGEGAVTVGFAMDAAGGALLSVDDEGRDLPEDFDPTQTRGLGMRLVRRLLRDQEATLEVDRSVAHTRMVVHLPKPVLRKPLPMAAKAG